MTSLLPKQQLFVAEYILDWNATQAAIRAGYSARSAKKTAFEMLRKPEIQAAVADEMAARNQRTRINADILLVRLDDEDQADIADLFDDNNNLLPVKQWPKVFRQGLISGLEINELFEGRGDERKQIGLVKKIKLTDRIKHKELIGKHVDVRAFRDQIELSGKLSIADEIRKRRAERCS